MCDRFLCLSKRAILVHFLNVRQATNQVANQVHPCDHSLLRELFQPGRDIRQVVIRARWHLLLYMNASSLFCCSFWILPFHTKQDQFNCNTKFIKSKRSRLCLLSLYNINTLSTKGAQPEEKHDLLAIWSVLHALSFFLTIFTLFRHASVSSTYPCK